MHLGRFNYVTSLIETYFEENEIVSLVDQVIAQLNAYISSQTKENSVNFRAKVGTLLQACSFTPPGYNSASFRHIVADTHGEEYIGVGLEISLKNILEEQSITPAEMMVSLKEFRKNLSAYSDSITALSSGLITLGVEYEELKPDQFEFGAMFPKELVGTSINEIQDELIRLNYLFKTLNELMGKGPTSPTVSNISSSWWQFFIELDYQQIAAISFAIERIVALYKSNLEIQKLKQDSEKNGLGEEITALINQKIEEKLKSGMQEIAKDIRKKIQQNNDNERCNELETQLRMELVHIAKRINQGAAYEIRAGLPEEPEDIEAEQDEVPDPATLAAHQEKVKAYNEKLHVAEEVNGAGQRLAEAIEEIASGEKNLLMDYAKLTADIQVQPVANPSGKSK